MTAFLIVVLSLCACTSVPKGCTIEGTVKDKSYEGKQVYLRHALTPETYDSTIVKNGTFRFTLGETSPEVSLLVLKASSDDLFPVTLPVVTEKGVVKVVLGELVLTSGTDLNDRLQDFLLAVDRFGDEMAGKGESHGKIKKDFSVLLESSILQNKDNEVGVYIFRSYGSRLSPEQKAHIAERAGEWFRKRLDMSQLSNYYIWNAHYNVASSPIACNMWQGTCTARIPGYGGQIDVNISYMG